MATTADYIEFVVDQIEGAGAVRALVAVTPIPVKKTKKKAP
ncbi:MAG TPA: hypothetical protein PLV73_02035 [Treponemataceae bacterium]|jgi:hypothetical protein|nr:MAG: hypothetical protein BWY20_00661 [Spirochaetes bacterium ADurb.Bin215]HPA09583.1 hypothetical protein [Treponemataceae bacterium]HPX14661.1 hypothetical protein [Treponemataceae bacterium]HQB89209.1 hypothetical protein [Treponemataceae bacterium]